MQTETAFALSCNEKTMAAKTTLSDDVPQWKKDLIARLRNQNKKNEERLWIDHHTPHAVHTHPHPKTELVCPSSPENGFDKDQQSTESSDSEDLHYGPGIVNRLRNKYLSLALRENNVRPTILRKATSLEGLLDEDEGEESEKGDGRIFRRRGGGKDGGSHLNHYRGTRRQDMKRARSVEAISRVSHDEELTMTLSVTTKINNRQSLHEDILLNHRSDVKTDDSLDGARSPTRPASFELKVEDNGTKLNGNKPHKTWWKSPLLDEKEKPPADYVKQAKLIFEKRPEQRTKKPPQTGDVAAKVDSFNNIIVKAKVASKSKPPLKHVKPTTNERQKNNTPHHRSAKPVIIAEEIVKPNSLDLKGPKIDKKEFGGLPSPIPDVSRVDIKSDGSDSRNSLKGHLCETPDLILTSSPLPKITSPTYRKTINEHFLDEERNSGYIPNIEATNRYVSPIHSPKHHLNEDKIDSPGIKLISPISQNNITKNSASSVFNFVHSQLDQKHLPPVIKSPTDQKSPVSEPSNVEVNGFNGTRVKRGLSAFEIEKNHKNAIKSGVEEERVPETSDGEIKAETAKRMVENSDKIEKEVRLSTNVDVSAIVEVSSDVISDSVEQVSENVEKIVGTPLEASNTVSVSQSKHVASDSGRDHEKNDRVALKHVAQNSSDKARSEKDNAIKIAFPKKTKPRVEESTTAVFNFTARKDVPNYIANDTSRTPSRPVIPRPDEPGIKILSDSLIQCKEIQEVLEEDELIRNLKARPPSPCNVTFINDNILIDGKSNLTQTNSKRTKCKISFVEDAEIYEYPSETSLLLEESHLPPAIGTAATVGHAIPSLSGSTLATYIPKTVEGFELGVTRTPPPPPPRPDVTEVTESNEILEEIEKPILFSSGGTSDMLF